MSIQCPVQFPLHEDLWFLNLALESKIGLDSVHNDIPKCLAKNGLHFQYFWNLLFYKGIRSKIIWPKIGQSDLFPTKTNLERKYWLKLTWEGYFKISYMQLCRPLALQDINIRSELHWTPCKNSNRNRRIHKK